MKENTYILHQGEALVLVLVVLMLLLPSQVFVFGRLKTHGYHLRAGQHLASAFESDKSGSVRFGSGQENRCPCRDVFGEDAVGRSSDRLSALRPHDSSSKPRLRTAGTGDS